MSFPVASSNGQTALVNGITYAWNSSIGTWTRQQAYLGQIIVSNTAPSINVVGTQWYSQTDDVIYEWTTSNGSNFFWLDITSSAVVSNVAISSYLANTVSNTSNTIANTANSLIITQESLSVANVFAAGGAANTANASFNNSNAAFSAANSALILSQNPQTTNYTLQLSDSGKHIYNTGSGGQIITVPNNGTVSWQIGTTIVLVYGANNAAMNIQAATGVTMYLANSYIQKSYANLYAWGVGSLLNVGANTWFINGSGVT